MSDSLTTGKCCFFQCVLWNVYFRKQVKKEREGRLLNIQSCHRSVMPFFAFSLSLSLSLSPVFVFFLLECVSKFVEPKAERFA